MFDILDRSSGNILGVLVSGKLTDEDYQKLTPKLEQIINQEGTIRLLCILEEFQGWTAKAAWDDLKLDVKHHQAFERLAVVGDTKLEAFMTQISKPFIKGEVKYFERKHADQAWDWIRS